MHVFQRLINKAESEQLVGETTIYDSKKMGTERSGGCSHSPRFSNAVSGGRENGTLQPRNQQQDMRG